MTIEGMNNPPDARTVAHREGKQANLDGKRQIANPYDLHGENELWNAWLTGWYYGYFLHTVEELDKQETL